MFKQAELFWAEKKTKQKKNEQALTFIACEAKITPTPGKVRRRPQICSNVQDFHWDGEVDRTCEIETFGKEKRSSASGASKNAATHGRRVQESSRHSRISAAAVTLSNKWKPEDSSGKPKKRSTGLEDERLGKKDAGTAMKMRRRRGSQALLLQGRTVAGPGQRLPLSHVSLGLWAKAAM